jgi:hypothetical protein
MAPDAPGNLVVLDLSYDSKGRLLKTVEDVEPSQVGLATGWLRVRFDEAPGDKFYPVGKGVAYVRQPEGYDHGPPDKKSEVFTLPGARRYMFTNVAQGEGLQLILILPKGYTLSEFSPTPSNAKEFHHRIALYFRPKEKFGETAKVTFGLKSLEGDIKSEVERLRDEFLRPGNIPTNAGAYVDREDPEFKEVGRQQNDAQAFNMGQPLSASAYATIALVGLTIGVGLLLFYVYQVPKLVETGSESRVYYLLLIPWALACAAFLFGTMRSYARYTGKHLGNALELGGPVVLFCLVLVGGFKLVPQTPESFDLTIRPHSSDGSVPMVTSGRVVLDLDYRREASIAKNGEADFKGIPGRFRGTTVKILPLVSGYKQEWQQHKLRSTVLELPLEPAGIPLTRLTGTLVPLPKNWKRLRVVVEGQASEGSVDELGRFELSVSGREGDSIRLRVFDGNRQVYDDYQTLPGPVTIKLPIGLLEVQPSDK